MGFLDDPRAREASRLAFLADRMRSGGDEAEGRRRRPMLAPRSLKCTPRRSRTSANFCLLIEAALREGGSITNAAAILGLSRHALRRRLDKYGIEQPHAEKQSTTDPVGRRTGDPRDA